MATVFWDMKGVLLVGFQLLTGTGWNCKHSVILQSA